jgi:hypothetical protein
MNAWTKRATLAALITLGLALAARAAEPPKPSAESQATFSQSIGSQP